MAFPKFIKKALKLGKIEREILHIGHKSLVTIPRQVCEENESDISESFLRCRESRSVYVSKLVNLDEGHYRHAEFFTS